MTEEIPPYVRSSLLLHKVLVVDPLLLFRGDPRNDGDLVAGCMAVPVLGRLEELVHGKIVYLVDNLEGLDEVTPHPPILKESQPK